MKAIDVLMQTTEYAKSYRKDAIKSVERNRHMNQIEEGEQLQQRHIDAVLVDFINYIGAKHGIDFALYTKDVL
jgi:hypothetical protein